MTELWKSEYSLEFEEFFEVYKVRYEIIRHQREVAKSEELTSLEKYKLRPNSMQEEFIVNLRKILESNEQKALLISATGERVIIVTGRRNAVNKRVLVA